MCRMIFATGKFNTDWLIDDMIQMALDQNEKHEENTRKVFKHEDGWGVCYLEDNQLKIIRSDKAFFDDPKVDELRKIQTPLFILHTRHASKGKVDIHNVHPFEYRNEHSHYVFFHNGTIEDRLSINGKFQLQGTTDSERYFYYLLSDLNEGSQLDESWLRSKLSKITNFTGANFILTNGETNYIANWYAKNPLYYTMKILQQKDSVLISSEILPHLKDKKWDKLKNHSIFVIKTDNRK